MKVNKIMTMLITVIMLMNLCFAAAAEETGAFELISEEKSDTLGGTVYQYRHVKTGAEIVYNDNNSTKREFVIGFKTMPTDSKGANHVLEHALFCGSEKYPTKNIMHYIQNGTSSLILNGVTADDCTYYLVNTENETEYYNMIDVYMNGIFHPMVVHDENIFRQQGIRVEYADGKARYNGVVYNELRIKNLNTEENSVNFLADKLYRAIYGDTAPSFSAGGELDAIKELTYEDVMRVYSTFYIPSNSMTYISGSQDIKKTLNILDGFFSEIDTEAPEFSFADTKKVPTQPIQEYNVSDDTKTVDIGFMSSGVPADAEARERYARDIIFDIISAKTREETGCTETYTSGGNSGGISNLAFMISEVPKENKEECIAAYKRVINTLTVEGISEKDIDEYIKKQQQYFYAGWDNIFNGLMYHKNPLAYTEINSVCEFLKNNKEYLAEILKKYFTENPYSVIVVSGNGLFGSEDSVVKVSDKELEKLKRETEAFQKWNDEEDDPAVIEKIPFLTLDEVKMPPAKAKSVIETNNGITFYYTEKDSGEASLYFPLDIKEEDFDYVQLLHYFLQKQKENAGIDFYTMLLPMADAGNSQKLNPQFLIGIWGDDESESISKVMDFLRSEETWNADDLSDYIETEPEEILSSYYDPYFLSSSLKSSALSAQGSFKYLFELSSFVKGSPHYYNFLQSLDSNCSDELIQKLRSLAQHIIIDSKPVVGYTGQPDPFNKFRNAVSEIFKDGSAHRSANLTMPVGYYSAAVITKLADANHFMLAADYGDNEYSGKMAVLGKLLSTKYIIPTMRGKYGAYGCNISFREDEVVSAVAGLADVDLAVEIWQGMGDYLRGMKMTQNELNSFIVAAVQEYDEWDYTESESSAAFALQEKSEDRLERIRNEMLATTVEDIKGYADFVDSLVSQNRVFAVLGKAAAADSAFDFAYYANADTLKIVPALKKNPKAYINGISENLFAPDDYITRAEIAVMIDRITADRRSAQHASPFNDVKENDWFYSSVVSLAVKGIIDGYENGDFKPQSYISRAELSEILSKFIYDEYSGAGESYLDMDNKAWFYVPVSKMISKGYITGYDDNTIRPAQAVTRAEAVTIINRMLNLTYSDTAESPFRDLKTTHWAYKEIMAAARKH